MIITEKIIKKYAANLVERECSEATVSKYIRCAVQFMEFLEGKELTKQLVISFKESLSNERAASGANAVLAAVNGLLKFIKKDEFCVKAIKIQRNTYISEQKELTEDEYKKMVKAAAENGDIKTALILQTICSTGIRVSELKFVTVESLSEGIAEIECKGKRRNIFIPKPLRKILKEYCEKQNNTGGPVFKTKNGKPIDRSNIWRLMKKSAKLAGVDPEKVYPHNLRHLFARTYYSVTKDISRLADILGHSNISTTRIYIMETGAVHEQQVNNLNLVVSCNRMYIPL